MKILVFALATYICLTRNAHAYIDPGSGSMMVQVLLGGTIGVLYWARDKIAAVFKKIFRR